MSERDKIKLAQFIADNGLTMTATRIEKRPDKRPKTPEEIRYEREASHWSIVLRKGGNGTGKGPETGSMTVLYSMGSALKGKPKITDVLDCIASDASGYENARTFEEWAVECGYDTDSRAAEKIFNTIGEQVADLKDLLGDSDAYNTLLFHTERL